MNHIPIETVKKLDLQPGDILHIRVGMDLEDGMAPWIPTEEDLEQVQRLWEAVLPEGVRAIYTHCGIDEQVIRKVHSDVTHWPPRTP